MRSNENRPGLGGMLREMFRDRPETYRDAEDIDAELEREEAEEKDPEEDAVVDYIEPDSERAMQEEADAAETLKDLIIGCVILSLMILAVGMFCAAKRLRYGIGVGIGLGFAILLLRNMYQSIEMVLYMDEQSAVRYAKKRAVIRYFILMAGMAAVFHFGGKTMAAGMIPAAFTMKFSAFLQPLTNRIRKNLKKGR